MRFAILALSLFFWPVTGFAQGAGGEDPLAGLDAYVARAVQDWEVPGLAIAVVKDDSVVFAKGYGVRALGSDDAVTPRTLFANASTTKAFTALAVALMVDEGKLGWDDLVADHLPTFVVKEPYVSRETTIRDLLTHRVGFGDPGYLWYGVEYDYPAIVRRLRYIEPQSSFRSAYAYNNVSYATAGVVAGLAAGTSWDELVRRRILEPLGMRETVTQGRDIPARANLARPHALADDTLRVIPEYGIGLVDPIAPAGSMYSSALDMTRWIRFLLAEGQVGGNRLVSEKNFAELFRPQLVIPAGRFYPTARLTAPHFIAYGLGWFLQDYRGEFIAFHTGSIDGTVAIVGLMPERELGVVVFANRDHAELRHALMLRVFDAYLGGAARDWSAELKALYDEIDAEQRKEEEKIAAERVPDTRPTLPLAAYAGTYADSLYGTAEIRLENDALVLVRSPFLTADLSHWHYDVFQARWRHRWLGEDLITFQMGPDGKIAAVDVSGALLRRVPPPEPAPADR